MDNARDDVLEHMVRMSLTELQREVEGVLDRSRVRRGGVRGLKVGGGEKRGRERVEWGNREEWVWKRGEG